ncbi:MAG: hypothetical protein KGL39_14855 [Patescibacteria group bacterium]|nr:hypothetical protein [Patescibacteria group bacterium]
MKKYVLALSITLFLFPIIASASQYTTLLKEYVRLDSIVNGINPDLTSCIITHESQWISDKTGPEHIGASQGLWQIYLRMHRNITLEEANDPIWATTWSLDQIKAGRVSWWTTYGEYCKSIPVFLHETHA